MLIIQPKGGLGNILFIVCNGIALSKEYDIKLLVNSEYLDKRKTITEYKLFKNIKFVNQKFLSLLRDVNIYKENNFWYEKPKIISNKINFIDGYFQSYKYFINYIPEIKNLLFENMKDEIIELKNKHQKIKNNKNTVLLHIRRGDYINLQDIHPVQPREYYIKCLENISQKLNNLKLIIFSDDIEYVKKWGLHKKYDTYYELEEDPEKAFILMTLCDNFIIANSSMSLLSYYFRDNINGICYAPNKWFGDKGPQYKIEDILEEKIIRV